MSNGVTKYPSKAQLTMLKKEYDKALLKKKLAEKYDTSMTNIVNTIKNGRCSEKVYKKLFNVEALAMVGNLKNKSSKYAQK